MKKSEKAIFHVNRRLSWDEQVMQRIRQLWKQRSETSPPERLVNDWFQAEREISQEFQEQRNAGPIANVRNRKFLSTGRDSVGPQSSPITI